MGVGPLHISHMLTMSTELLRLRLLIVRVKEELYKSPIIAHCKELFMGTSVYAINMGHVNYAAEDALHWPAEVS